MSRTGTNKNMDQQRSAHISYNKKMHHQLTKTQTPHHLYPVHAHHPRCFDVTLMFTPDVTCPDITQPSSTENTELSSTDGIQPPAMEVSRSNYASYIEQTPSTDLTLALYINNLETSIISDISKFTDDSMIYRIIISESNVKNL